MCCVSLRNEYGMQHLDKTKIYLIAKVFYDLFYKLKFKWNSFQSIVFCFIIWKSHLSECMRLWLSRLQVILGDEWDVAYFYIAVAKQLFLTVRTQPMVMELTSKWWWLCHSNSKAIGKSLTTFVMLIFTNLCWVGYKLINHGNTSNIEAVGRKR